MEIGNNLDMIIFNHLNIGVRSTMSSLVCSIICYGLFSVVNDNVRRGIDNMEFSVYDSIWFETDLLFI